MNRHLAKTNLGQDVERIVARIVERFSPQQVIVFGSTARGDNRPDSDVDLIVVMPVAGSRRHLATEIERSLIGIPVAVDLLVLTPEELAQGRDTVGTVVRPALREGRVAYERAA